MLSGMSREMQSILCIAGLCDVYYPIMHKGFPGLDFVGNWVGRGVVEMDSKKVEKVLSAEPPTTKKQLKSFLGMAGWFSSFIPQFSELSAPLSDMTKKGSPNNLFWRENEKRCFEALKHALSQKPVLRLPDFAKPFVLQVDASERAVGGAILQEHDGKLFPISYASRKLLDRERNYSCIERECLALVFAVKKFEKYLYGREFLLYTDHQPLACIDKKKIENSRIMRWALYLQNFSYKIKVIKGSENVIADYLSRSYNV